MGLASVLGLALFTIGWILGPRRPDAEKLSPYECGFEAFEDSRVRFDVRYYLVAIIFIVFDLEIAFFFPWAVSLGATGTFGLLAMLVFALVLVVALLYDYKKGALEWIRSRVRRHQHRARLRSDHRRQADQLGPHGVALADDFRAGLLRGGNDARRRGALRPR